MKLFCGQRAALEIHLAAYDDRVKLSCYLIQLLDTDRVYLVINICPHRDVNAGVAYLTGIHTETGDIFPCP